MQPLSIPATLAEFQIADDNYYTALSISKDDDFELHMKRKPNSCFVNNCVNDKLKGWQANMDIIHLVYNKYKAVHILGKVFKNGPSKICGRQPLKNLK